MKIVNIVLGIIVSVSLIFGSMSPTLAQGIEPKVEDAYELQLVQKTNTERQNQKIKSLAVSEKLMNAAQLKADDMAKNSYFAHTSPSGVTPWSWFYKAGYKPSFAGENLALSGSLKSDVMKNWMKSEGHKKNVLSTKYTEIGIGISKGKYAGRDVYYIVQLFGKPGATK